MSERREVIWIAGGDGLVGRHFIKSIDKDKYDIVILSREKRLTLVPGIQFIFWDTNKRLIEEAPAPDHIINLAGAGIADERWTDARKAILISSRVNSALTIKQYLDAKNIQPRSYISASAVGFYGDRSDELLTEKSSHGKEFMSECCMEWERAAQETGKVCKRQVVLRIGIVLSTMGGALPKMLMTKNMGIFNYFGSGDQYYPWIHIDDLSRIFLTVLENDKYEGIYNAVAPQEITNYSMMKEIKQANEMSGLLLPAPTFVLRTLLGEMANVVLNSNRVMPKRLIDAGFHYNFINAGLAVKDLISNKI